MTLCPLHWPARQTVAVPHSRQLPAPSQVPSNPQLDGGDAAQSAVARGAAPAGRSMQTPKLPGAAHVWHPEVQAVAQQTPSAQKPLAQSAGPAHAWPRARGLTPEAPPGGGLLSAAPADPLPAEPLREPASASPPEPAAPAAPG
jgi:hypothetical protein